MKTGKVFLVGAGPGAPDLLTLRAADLLRRADIVFHDALVHADTIALAANAEKILVGKRCGRFSTAQRFINKRLIDAAKQFGVVVRLKGGDPMLFGRAQEEIDALREAGIEMEIVPGVTAALAASADLGVSLTRRGVSRSVVFATPRVGAGEDASDWIKSVLAADTAVVYMAGHQAAEIASTLIAAGLSPHTPVALVESASSPAVRAHYTNLARLGRTSGDLELRGPVAILVGEVYREGLVAAVKSGQGQSVDVNLPHRKNR